VITSKETKKTRKGNFMSSIKFNYLTKEIEISGSESFIEANFDKIQDLLIESIGVRREMVSEKTAATRKPPSMAETEEVQAGAEIRKDGPSAASPMLPAYESKAKRAPVRKYIRKEGTPGEQRMVVEVAEKKPTELSVESLKAKFGLSESKFGGLLRDAERLGKTRRRLNEADVWKQD
jgi:hypothetical protein